MSVARSVLLWASRSPFLSRTLPRRAFVKRAVKRFMPGEDVGSALEAAAALGQRGVGSVLTELGEQVTNAAEAAAVRDHYLGVYADVARRALPAEISVKLTHLGMEQDRAACAAHLDTLAAAAAKAGSWLFVDMEESRYVDATLELYRALRARHPNVGVCLQAYLRRTPADLEALAPLAPGIRLVKGAYREPPDVAFPAKRDVDEAYETLAGRMVELASTKGLRPVFGTHDDRLIRAIQSNAAARGLAPKAVEFHLLYGIRGDVVDRLAKEGVGVRLLISYGSAWFAWYMRRLAERPANVWFVVRNLF